MPSALHRIPLRAAVLAAVAGLALLAPAARADTVPPANITQPAWTAATNSPAGCIDASPCVYQTAHATRGTWTDESSLSFRFELLVCDANGQACDVALAFDGPDPDSVPMNITPDMFGRTVRFRVWATGPGGTTSATSHYAGPVDRGDPTTPVSQTAPSIDLQDASQPISGQTLIGRVGTWDDDFRDYVYDVSWLRCESNGLACRRITSRALNGPSDPVSYQMTASDVGYVIRLEVVASAAKANPPDNTVMSQPTDVVQNGGPPVNVTLPLLLVGSYNNAARPVSGPVSPGDTLTATAGTWTVNDNLSVNWLRCARDGTGCASIPGADSLPGQPARQSYTVPAADLGYSIRADVTAGAFLGSATVRTVAARVGPDPVGGTVVPPTVNPPKERATVRVRSAKLTGSGNTLAVYLSLGAAGKVTASAKGGGQTLGTAKRDLGAGKVAIAITLSKKARKLVKGNKKIKTTLALTLRTDAGNQGSLTQSLTLRGVSR